MKTLLHLMGRSGFRRHNGRPRSQSELQTRRNTGRVCPGHCHDAAPGLEGWQGDIDAAVQQFCA